MFHGHLDHFQKPSLGGWPHTKSGDHGTPNAHNRWLILFLSCVRTYMNRNSLKWHLVEGPVTYDFTLHLRVCDHTTWFWRCVGMAFGHFYFGLSKLNGHGSWLMCEVALTSELLLLKHTQAMISTYIADPWPNNLFKLSEMTLVYHNDRPLQFTKTPSRIIFFIILRLFKNMIFK